MSWSLSTIQSRRRKPSTEFTDLAKSALSKVETVRYIMGDSFEESMLTLQDKGEKLAGLSMDNQNKSLEKPKAHEMFTLL